jgi:hypothetical protein
MYEKEEKTIQMQMIYKNEIMKKYAKKESFYATNTYTPLETTLKLHIISYQVNGIFFHNIAPHCECVYEHEYRASYQLRYLPMIFFFVFHIFFLYF